jgi:putative transcriptional regulator
MRKSSYIILILWLGVWWADCVSARGYFMFPCATSDTTAGTAEGETSAHPVLAQGVLLVAGKNLLDPNFARTVILITEYGDEGTTGLVLNKRTTLAASHALPQLDGLAAGPDRIHIGGPIAVNHIHMLVKGDNVPGGATNIVDNIFMIDTMEVLRELGPEHMHQDNARLYLGYTGWAPGQLETELLHGDWFIWKASSEVIFSKHPESIWYELIYLVTAKWT